MPLDGGELLQLAEGEETAPLLAVSEEEEGGDEEEATRWQQCQRQRKYLAQEE